MGDKEFSALVKKVVCEYANAHLDVSDVIQISEDDKKRCYVDAYKKWENFCVNGAGERI